MHPSSALTTFAATFKGRSLTTVIIDNEPRWVGPEVSLLCSDDTAYVTKMISESPEFAVGVTHEVYTGTSLAELKARRLYRDFRASDGTELSEPLISQRAPSAIVLKEKGLWLVLQKTSAEVGVDLRRFLADEVLPKLARGETIGAPTEPKPVDALPGFREARLTLAEMRRNKVATSTIHRVAEHLYARLGISLTIEAASTPPAPVASPQLQLPLVSSEPEPEPEPEPVATPPTRKHKRTNKPPRFPFPSVPDDGNDWTGFVRAWFAKYGAKVVATTDLLRLKGFVDIEADDDFGLSVKLGKLLSERFGTVIAGYQILHRHSTTRGWSLKKMP